MLATFQPAGVLISVWFIRKRVVCAACPGGPIWKSIGT